MPRNIEGENLDEYADLTEKYGTLYRGKIQVYRDRSGQYQVYNARTGRNQRMSRADALRALQYNQLVTGDAEPDILENRPEADRVEPTPTFFPDLIGPPWPGADRRGPRTKWANYEPDLQRVTIEFRNGDVYRYMDVPPQVWETLKVQVSTGQYINAVLNNYPYQKIRSGIRGG